MLTLLVGALWGNRARSLITAAAVAVAVGAYLTVAFYFTVHVPQPHLPPVDLPADIVVTPWFARDWDAFEGQLMHRFPEVEALEPYRIASAYTADGVQEIIAADPGSRFHEKLVHLAEGSLPGPGQVLLPALEGMDWGTSVGEETSFMFQPGRAPRWHALVVSGFYEAGYRRFSCPVVTVETMIEITPVSVVHYMVHLEEGTDADAVAASMDRNHRDIIARVETASGIHEEELAHEWKETYQSIYNSARGLVVLLMAVAAVAILNTIYMAFLYRKRELGILKALGMKPRSLFTLLALEGLCLGAAGSLAATAVFLVVVVALNASGVTSGMLEPVLLAYGPGLGMVVSLVASVIPADAAQHASPLDLLRSSR